MSKNCNRCLVRKLKKRNKRLEAVKSELLACCLNLKSDLGNADWRNDPQVGTAILVEIIRQRWDSLRAAIAKAEGKEAGS